jgi:hypothetical protein
MYEGGITTTIIIPEMILPQDHKLSWKMNMLYFIEQRNNHIYKNEP